MGSSLLKVIRFVLCTLGFMSVVLVFFMAQTLETNFGSLDARILPDTVSHSRRATASMLREIPVVHEETRKTVKEPTTKPILKAKQQEEIRIKPQNEVKTEPHTNTDARLIDPRLADTTAAESMKEEEPEIRHDVKKPAVVESAKPKVTQTKNKAVTSSVADENVLVVIISNRRDGIIPTLASIITTSSKPVDVVLVGEHSINEQVRAHFGSRINEFTSMSVKDITEDLEEQGFKPIWTWPEWHTSMDPAWKNENTLHVGSWDNLQTHAHELNHLRFYLPHVSIFEGKGYFYFLDDDILVQKDLGVLAQKTMHDLDAKHGLVCPCNIWMWNSECFHFEFQSKKDYILSMPSLYGDREVCKTDSESHCVPANYWDFVESVMPEGGKDQHAWNFGFSLFALKNWRDLKLTEKYEFVMKENYRLHVFPETSLTFGLGVSYIAFAGNVECWNEDYVQVRDGFGFIEWDRYARTFGKDFFDYVDVVHFTGPDKPWVSESRIETRAITPWLNMMEQEKMPIPVQLPEQPTENLFTLLSSDRSGAQWMLSMLDSHPKVCASGEGDKPETGFPADVLLPDGLPWYPYCSIKRGCTYEFVSKSVAELTSNMTDANIPFRCTPDYDAAANGDPLVEHIERLCNIVKVLDGNYDGANVAKVWVDAFVAEDRKLMGCGCVRGVEAKGLKVMAEWILPQGYPFEQTGPPPVILDQTKVHGSKVIRLKRRNLWARYKSMLMAQQTGMYHPTSPAEKRSQIEALKPIKVEIEHMEWNMKHMEAVDEAGDNWAKEHASEILWLDYEDCRADTAGCFKRIYNFIGVDESHVTGKKASMYESMFAPFGVSDSTLEHIANRGEIIELLGINGWDHYVSDEKYIPIQFLVYEENDLLVDTRQYMGINASLFGQEKGAEGHGSKFSSALPILKNMDKDSLVVLSNDRDGRVNFPIGDHEVAFTFLHHFRETFEDLTSNNPGAVILSTDSDCCASALTHASPGDFFDEEGNRKNRACLSGEQGCHWAGGDKALPWQSFMKELASKRSETSSRHVYLDTGLIGGKAGDMAKLIEAVDAGKTEDDRAVLTDYMYRHPDLILLDYKQQLFGESRKASKNTVNDKCLMGTADVVAVDRRLEVHENNPLFMYSPQSLGCSDAKKISSPKYPLWNHNGIVFKPILDHIDRVADMKESIVLPPEYGRKPDYRQGPEVPYIIDDKGIWTSKLIRDRTESTTFNWRLLPTEGLMKVAHDVLMDENFSTSRWSSLKRAVKNGGFPFWSWFGDYKTCNYHNFDEDSIPLFTTCATAECNYTFPMPNYMTIIDSQPSEDNWRGVFDEADKQYPWESKRRQVVWRGALSEAEWTKALTSVRWRFAKLVHELNSPLYDAGLTGIPSWLTDKIDFNMTEIGSFVKGIKPMTSFQEFMAVLDMDGNSWSSRFGSLLCYNSVVLKVEPQYFEYFYADLKPWSHYIPIKNDLSDLHENVEWALDPKNEAAVKDIITAANQWCTHSLIPQELAADVLDIWESYVRLLDRGDKDWQKEWEKKREEMFVSSRLDMQKLEE